MDTPETRLKRAIASARSDVVEVEVIKFSHPVTETIWMSQYVEDGATIIDPDGNVARQVRYIPLVSSEHKQGGRMTAGRVIAIQGLNHIIRAEEDKIGFDDRRRATLDFYTFLMQKDGTLSSVVQGPLRFYLQKAVYSNKKNSVNLNVSTSPTNVDETGIAVNKRQFPGIEAFI